ncbi:MAG: hypothetical protein HN531_09070 [Opitutae bacterium]|jgi:hypothetical protein|nr:hypothetical protein [Opitutae bacterium]
MNSCHSGTMAFEGLVTELKRLIKDRVSGSQAKESIESFGQERFLLDLRFVSSSRTFGSDVGKEYEAGKTVICDWIGHDLQVAVRMMPSTNDWVKELPKGEEFELWGYLFSYDTLYDRAIFGHALEGDPQEQPHSESEPISEQPQAVLPKKAPPLQPQEVIKREVRRTKRVKLPKQAKTRRASERKLYRKSSDAAAPGRDKRMFWGKPRNLKIVKRPGSSPKRVGHAVPSKKPLKRTLKSAPKADHRRSGQSGPPVDGPKFRVSNQANPVVPPNPAAIVRILQKKNAGGNAAISPLEYQTLKLAGLESIGTKPFGCSEASRRSIAILLLVISLPACVFSSGNTFGLVCLSCAIVLLLPDFLAK